MSNSANNKRIAKNTALLYVRMLLIMGVTLYTSRVVLNTLGVEDFGIYNVVGGIVVMFSFLNSAMSSATQRYLSFALGQKDHVQFKKVFNHSIYIHLFIAFFIVLLAETVGLWFLETQLIIPSDRMDAARWVYQFSVLTFVVSVIQTPYNASIISHEKMNIYAYGSILEVSLKLGVVYLLLISGFDKLKLYAILVFLVSFLMTLIYSVYCSFKLKGCQYQLYFERKLFNSLFAFSGWNLFGNLAWVTMGQGSNMLLNMFFGPTVNASRGIAFQINAAISSFIGNFRTAINPQIIKSYSLGNREYMNNLVFEGAKYSYFLLLFLTLPVLLETEFVLKIWLKIVPVYAVLFCQLILINTLIQSFDASFGIVFQAMGRIKETQLLGTLIYLLVLPISYLFLKMGYQAEVTFYIQIVATIFVSFGVKIYLLSKIADITPLYYANRLFLPVLKVTMVGLIFPIIIRNNMSDTYVRFFIVSFSSCVSLIISIYFLGINREDRIKIKNKISLYIHKK